MDFRIKKDYSKETISNLPLRNFDLATIILICFDYILTQKNLLYLQLPHISNFIMAVDDDDDDDDADVDDDCFNYYLNNLGSMN